MTKLDARYQRGLTTRSLRGLIFTSEQKAVRYDQLGQYFDPDLSPARDEPADQVSGGQPRPRGGRREGWPHDRKKRLHTVAQIVDTWCAQGLAHKERPILDQPMWVCTSNAGLRALGLLYQDAHFYDAAELNHLYQVTQVRLELARATQVPVHTWISERAIAATFAQKTAGVALPHLPDGALELEEDAAVSMGRQGVLTLKRGDRIAIEVELTRKSFARLDEILLSLLEQYSAVWYFCEPKPYDALLVARQLLTPAQQQRIRVLHLDARA